MIKNDLPIEKLKKELNDVSDSDLWLLYAYLELKLKERGLVRTRNTIGERGEFLAIETYNKTSGLPKLQAAPEGTQNVDALSRKGERYSIKALTFPSNTTSVFYGLAEKGEPEKEKKFEYVIVVIIDQSFNLIKMVELTWEQFIKFRKWHKTMRAWNLTINRQLLSEARIIFQKEQGI